MHFTTVFSSLIFAASAFAVNLTTSGKYDVSGNTLYVSACPSLRSKYPTYGDIPNFSYIAGSSIVTEEDSQMFGTCWQLTTAEGSSITVSVIDKQDDGYVTGNAPYYYLTGKHQYELPFVDVEAVQLDASECGF